MEFLTNQGMLTAMLLDGAASATKGDMSTFNGRPVIAVRMGGDTIYVATTGTPYPLRIGSLDLSQFNESFSLKVPNSDDVIDGSTLAKSDMASCLG